TRRRHMMLVIARQRLHVLQSPQPEPAPKRRLVMAQPGARGQRLQLAGIPTTQHNIIRYERLHEDRDYLAHDPPPGPLAQPLQAALAQGLIELRAVWVREAAQLQGDNDPVRNQ